VGNPSVYTTWREETCLSVATDKEGSGPVAIKAIEQYGGGLSFRFI
jgi:hypothetical protein